MCGIVGYTGEASATPILVEGLTRMEYRGYDSAGVAVEQDVAGCRGGRWSSLNGGPCVA